MKYGYTYTANKGWPDKFKGTKLSTDFFTTVEESVKAGHFKDEEALCRAANAMLAIRKGHAAQGAAKETKEVDGKVKAVGEALTTAQLQEVFNGANYAEGFSTKQRTGGVTAKRRTELGTRVAQTAASVKALSPAERERKIAAFRELGYEDADLRELGLLDAAPTAKAAKK